MQDTKCTFPRKLDTKNKKIIYISYHTFEANAYDKQKPLWLIHLFLSLPHLKKKGKNMRVGAFISSWGEVSSFNISCMHFNISKISQLFHILENGILCDMIIYHIFKKWFSCFAVTGPINLTLFLSCVVCCFSLIYLPSSHPPTGRSSSLSLLETVSAGASFLFQLFWVLPVIQQSTMLWFAVNNKRK